MPGGTWLTQNKVRPAAYINFSQVPTPLITVGDRGIATIAMELPWGAENSLIEVLSSDMLDGGSRKLIGYTAFDTAESLIARVMLSNCYKVKFFKINSGSVKASAVDDTTKIIVTAKYGGTAGNKITIQIAESKTTAGRFTLTTFWNGLEVASQVITALAQIENNDYVTFDVTDTAATLAEIAGLPLKDGANGTYNKDNYTKYFELLETARWQTMAIVKDAETVNPLAAELVENLRENEGRKVQCAIYDDSKTYDYEGVIRSEQGLNLDNDEALTAELTPALVAAFTAGADLTMSNTGRTIASPAAIGIINEFKNSVIIEKINEGCFVFSKRDDDTIQCEKDINTFHTFIPTKGYQFSKNKVIRVIDNIATDINTTWDASYKGKVANNDNGRQIFKGDVINYIKTLQNIGAVDTRDKDDALYDINANLTVKRGEKVDAVYTKLYGLPVVDNMEILYMDVVLQAG
ncbi:phage tail sheath C-terminal domain-containing protein [Anaerosinus massiliensis]|uniref:phage tail sheath C-terminal domain-containing protein n=1 Tax=Massilibacillus massiliensis TaxID=1806837 RepID=UPI000DA5F6F6|nr:phage tail sheath C-terminal domain-containing protein [Massilibacillus massiliensis]